MTAPLVGLALGRKLQQFLPVADMTLSDELRKACDSLVSPGSTVANFHNTAGWLKATVA